LFGQEALRIQGALCCGDMGLAAIEGEQGAFDLVLAIGVIHHLDDAQAARLLIWPAWLCAPPDVLLLVMDAMHPNSHE